MSLEGSQLGHYRLTRQIGSGGMGEIYLAEDTRIARQVAVKVVRNEPTHHPDANATQESTRLFRREMKAVASLDNPHILTLLDFGEETINRAAITYMVMPYRPEGSLNDWMSQRTKKLSLEEINHILQQAADALQHAHDSGIIHQDVKPSNFLIRSKKDRPNQPDLLLADFGIAKMLSATSTASQTARGTATFMPPEQWDGNPVPATDQYALAIMAYLLLTGQAPFQGRMEQVMRQQFMTEPQPPSKLNPEIHADVDKVILHALAKKPEERFASVSNFANAFQQALQYTKQPTSPQPILEPTIYASGPPTPNPEIVTPKVSVAANTPPDRVTNKVEYVPPPPPPPVKLTSQKTHTRIFVLIALASILVLSSIVGIAAYQNHVYQDDAFATADADAYATATSQADQANVSATATVVAANPYPSYLAGSRGKLALYGLLTNEGNWTSGKDSTGSCQFSNGAYHITQSKTNSFYRCEATIDVKNFAFEVQMTIVSGDCGGMLFRADTSSEKFYYYEICQDGAYTLERLSGNAWTTIRPSYTSRSINVGSGKSNTIAVVGKGDEIDMYANKQLLYSAHDSSYLEGQIALFADDRNYSTEVSFSNARVWTL